ncbi:MAG: hypothetical protein WBD48_00145 [Pseudolabrys sp.]
MAIIFRILIGAISIGISIGLAAMTGASTRERVVSHVIQCKLIKTAAQLQAMHSTGTYCLANDIDASTIANFTPIGTFNGRLYGNGYAIRNLTINASSGFVVGFIGEMTGGLIQDLGLVNVNVTSSGGTTAVGSLVGFADNASAPVTITRVYATGQVKDLGGSNTGGLIGFVNAGVTVTESWTSVNVTGFDSVGGFIGSTSSDNFQQSHATGSVTCSGTCSSVGGFAGTVTGSSFSDSYATGPVTAPNDVGGFIGGNSGSLTRCYATGPVHAGASGAAGSLIGADINGTIAQSFGAGNVGGNAGASLGGLIGTIPGGITTVTDSYWDTVTTGQTTSAAGLGTGRSTTQLRAALPSGFDSNAWGITKNLSYPYLQQSANFASPLATNVSGINIFTYVPISQLDASQYRVSPHHTDAASLAAVYTMFARAVGFGANVAQLTNVKIDKYFWRDATQTTFFRGPLTLHATLGPLVSLAPAARLNNTNVIGQLGVRRLVILRGTYSKTGGGTGTHWMLATMYTRPSATVGTVVANDPWTGTQVEINPSTRTVISPRNFPLANFKVDGYQAVTVN